MDPIAALLLYAQQMLATVAQSVTTAIGSAVQNVSVYVETLISGITSRLSTLISNIATVIQGIVAPLIQKITDILAPIISTLNTLIQTIKDSLSNMIKSVIDTFNALWSKVQTVITSGLEAIRSLISTINAQLSNLIDLMVSKAQQAFEWVRNVVTDFSRAALDQVRAIYNVVAAAIRNGFEQLQAYALQVIGQTAKVVNDAWAQLVTGAKAIIETVNRRIADLNTAFTKASDKLAAGMVEFGEEHFAPLRDALIGVLKPFASVLAPKEYAKAERAVLDAIKPGTLDWQNISGFDRWVNQMLPQHEGLRAAFLFVFSAFITFQGFTGVVQANAEVLLQDYGRAHPYKVLGPAEAAAAYYRGALSYDQAVNVCRLNGYTADDASRLIDNGLATLPLGEVAALWARGAITEADVDRAAKLSGLDPVWTRAYKATAKDQLPPLQDVVTMSVREVFSPQAVTYGQFEDFPEVFAKHAEKLGYSPEWAKAYWAAHWNLPSPQMAFEMFHRGIIKDEEELKSLLKALDVMPYWRDRMLQLNYHPLGRVDIRRMHKLGVLKDDQLQRKYQDLGYSPEEAGQLALFTIKLNAPRDSGDAELGKLSREKIVDLYADGLVEKDKAQQMLTDLGMTPDGARLMLAAADLDASRRERRERVQVIVDNARAHAISQTEAETQLRNLGLTETELDRAKGLIRIALQTKARLPSHADLNRWLVGRMITEQEYRDVMGAHGYADKWVTLYLTDARRSRDNA